MRPSRSSKENGTDKDATSDELKVDRNTRKKDMGMSRPVRAVGVWSALAATPSLGAARRCVLPRVARQLRGRGAPIRNQIKTLDMTIRLVPSPHYARNYNCSLLPPFQDHR